MSGTTEVPGISHRCFTWDQAQTLCHVTCWLVISAEAAGPVCGLGAGDNVQAAQAKLHLEALLNLPLHYTSFLHGKMAVGSPGPACTLDQAFRKAWHTLLWLFKGSVKSLFTCLSDTWLLHSEHDRMSTPGIWREDDHPSPLLSLLRKLTAFDSLRYPHHILTAFHPCHDLGNTVILCCAEKHFSEHLISLSLFSFFFSFFGGRFSVA